jgi:hypothetical protein
VITNIVALVPLIDKKMPIPYHVMLTFPKAALVNAMGCKVFRDVKFGRVAESFAQSTVQAPNSGRGGSGRAGGRYPTLSIAFGGRTTTDGTAKTTETDSSHEISRLDPGFSPYQMKSSATESTPGAAEDLEWQMKTKQSNMV